jgi:hypothetical protein
MNKSTYFLSRCPLLAATMIMITAWLLTAALGAHAQTARTSHVKLMGAPVFAADGIKVGQVVDVSTTDNGRIDRIRITTASPLGFGERTVEIPRTAFVVVGG